MKVIIELPQGLRVQRSDAECCGVLRMAGGWRADGGRMAGRLLQMSFLGFGVFSNAILSSLNAG